MGEETLLVEIAALQVGEIADGEVDVAVLHRLGELLRGHADRAHGRLRRGLGEGSRELRKEHHLADVGHRERERPMCSPGIEGDARPELLLDMQQDLARGVRDLRAARRRRHALAGADEEGVVEVIAQLCEALAHRRLADAEDLRRLAHASGVQHRHCDAKQVQVEFAANRHEVSGRGTGHPAESCWHKELTPDADIPPVRDGRPR